MTVDDFLDLRWRSLPDDGFTVEVMSFGGNRFEVRHVGDDHHVGYINGIPVGAADNMERAVRLIYAKWNR
jgi:hypothetical protein